jgi:hypothetical protein
MANEIENTFKQLLRVIAGAAMSALMSWLLARTGAPASQHPPKD